VDEVLHKARQTAALVIIPVVSERVILSESESEREEIEITEFLFFHRLYGKC
jgi:hypothetical protein